MMSLWLVQLATQNVHRVLQDPKANGRETRLAVKILCWGLGRLVERPVPVERPPVCPPPNPRMGTVERVISSSVEASRCKALLMAVLVRAAHDLVLYRGSARLEKRQLAQDAHEWLFETACADPPQLTSFQSICDVLDLDPDNVRTSVNRLDVRTILNAGRPPENRKRRGDDVATACFRLNAIDHLIEEME